MLPYLRNKTRKNLPERFSYKINVEELLESRFLGPLNINIIKWEFEQK